MSNNLDLIDEIVMLLEAEVPASIMSPKNKKLIKKATEILADYFNKLEQAFPYDKIDSIYTNNIKEVLSEESDEIIDPILKALQAKLIADLTEYYIEVYLSASAEVISFGKTKLGIPIKYEGPPMRQAIDYARDQCAKLVTHMTTESKQKIAQIISDGIQNKRGIPGLARDIRAEFKYMSKYRTELIAKTETRNALFHASQDRMEAMGVTGKEWLLGSGGLSGNCGDCQDNAAVGAIPVTDDFPTPQYDIHPGCTCNILPVMLEV